MDERFSDLFEGTVLDDAAPRGDGVTHVWSKALPGRDGYRIEFHASGEGEDISLERVRLIVNFHSPTGSGEEIAWSEIEFGDTLDPATGIPLSATFTVFFHNPQPHWSVTLIELENRGPATITDTTFREPFTEGMDVADERYKLGYTVGDTVLNLDGRVLLTDRPLDGDVGDSLEEWVASGHFEDVALLPATGSEAPTDQPTEESGGTWWRVGIGILIMGAGIGLLARRKPAAAP